MLRKIWGSKRDDIRGGWRKRHNVELHKVYSLLNTDRVKKEMGRTCSMHRRKRKRMHEVFWWEKQK